MACQHEWAADLHPCRARLVTDTAVKCMELCTLHQLWLRTRHESVLNFDLPLSLRFQLQQTSQTRPIDVKHVQFIMYTVTVSRCKNMNQSVPLGDTYLSVWLQARAKSSQPVT